MTVINSIADANSVIELKGGYSENKCKTVLATVMGTTVGFVAFEGEPISPCCSYKAEAMVKLCDLIQSLLLHWLMQTAQLIRQVRKINALQRLPSLQALMLPLQHLRFPLSPEMQ